MIKLAITDTKARQISSNQESLKLSLEDVLRSKKELEGSVWELKVEMVDTYGTYFGCAKVRVSFLYPTLDLSMMDIFKVICDG